MKLKNTIASLVLISSLIGFPTQLIAEPLKIDTETIPEKIEYYSEQYNVSSELMTQIISCETSGTFDSKIQSKILYKFSSSKRGIVKGTQEQSYGLAQIHLPDHPEVTYEQATDADFALEFMANELSKENGEIWSCYKIIKGI